MVVKMMKWRPRPELSSKKMEAKITINCLKGVNFSQDFQRLVVEIKWKGSKGNSLTLSSLKRKSVKKNFTKEESLKDGGVVYWNEEFKSLCNFSVSKEIAFHPWEVSFRVFNVRYLLLLLRFWFLFFLFGCFFELKNNRYKNLILEYLMRYKNSQFVNQRP